MVASQRGPIAGIPGAVARRPRSTAGWTRRASPSRLLGRFPELALASSVGLLLVVAGSAAGPMLGQAALVPWWAGLLLMWVPTAVRLWGSEARTGERLLLVVVLIVGLQLVSVALSPGFLRDPDELSHLRTYVDLMDSGRLFSPNPLLVVSPAYPGLEAATASVELGLGIPVGMAGPLVVVIARVTAGLALFLLVRAALGSPRIAGLAVAVYAANPSYLMFDAAWSYESLALPLAIVAVWAVHGRWRRSVDGAPILTVTATIAIAAVAVTHHLTAIALAVTLVTWAAAAVLLDQRRPIAHVEAVRRRSPRPIVQAAIWAVVLDALWLLTAAPSLLGYLGGIGRSVADAVTGLIDGESGRAPFAVGGPYAVPLPEILVGWAGQIVLLVVLGLSAVHVLRHHRRDPLILIFLVAAAIYPITLALRLTGAGAETSQRATAFLFLGIAPIVADGLVHARFRRRDGVPVVAAVLALTLSTGVVLGTAWYLRVRGEYRAGAEQLSVEPQGVAVARWALRELGPRNRFVADRTNQKLLAGIGRQDPVTAYNRHLGTAYAMWGAELTDDDRATLRAGAIGYVLADRRITEQPPLFPYVFEIAEPDAGRHQAGWPAEGLAKWDRLPGSWRVLDSGDIRVYDVEDAPDAGR